MLLKGLHMGALAYDTAEARFTWDLDLLVREASWRAATDVLTGLGFRKPAFARSPGWMISRCTHALPLERPGDTCVDLHWALRKLPGVDIDMERVWSRGQEARIGGLECRVPCNEHVLLMLLLGIADDRNRGKSSLRSHWDIYLLMKRQPVADWRSFFNERDDEGLLPLIVNSMDVVLRTLQCRDEFPGLARTLEEFSDVLLPAATAPDNSLPQRWLRTLANRWWFIRLQPRGLWYYCGWWFVTLPMRFLLHQNR